jgi:hypothetical protein
MERRNRSSIKALKELVYIDSLDNDTIKASRLKKWAENYFVDKDFANNFELDLDNLRKLEELFFKNINFLKQYITNLKLQLQKHETMKKFFV